MDNIKRIKNLIFKSLIKEIDSDFCLLDVPTHRNIGDLLIWQGELDFLKKEVNYSMKYSSSIDSFNPELVKCKLILLHGGGNFGDLWIKHQKFREKIIKNFKDKKIIIFPQTVYFSNRSKLKKSAKIFSEHPNLIICARDKLSYNILKNNFKNNTIILVPDMAFYLDRFDYQEIKSNKDVLYFLRKDKEMVEYSINFGSNIKIKDWPTFEYPIHKKFKHISRKLFWIIKHKINKLLNIADLDDSFAEQNRSKYIYEGASFLLPHRLIVTNRLHGQIFARLLGIPSILLDNSYGKNKNFYNSWLKKDKLCMFAGNGSRLNKIMKDIIYTNNLNYGKH